MPDPRENVEELGRAIAAQLARGPHFHGLRWAAGWLVLAYAAINLIYMWIYCGNATGILVLTWLPLAWIGLSLLGAWRCVNDWYDRVARWTVAGWLVLLIWAWLTTVMDHCLASTLPVRGGASVVELMASETAAAVLAVGVVRGILHWPPRATSLGSVPIPVATSEEHPR